MLARVLAWYSCGILSLGCLLSLFVSVAPAAEPRFTALQIAAGGGALCFAAVAIILTRLPEGHWGNRSTAVRCLLSVAALCSSLLVAASVG